MSIIFKYLHIQRKDGTLRKAPFIPVYLRKKDGRRIRVGALIDSGADNAVVPKELAILIGLKEKPGSVDTGGIGGKVKVKKSRLQFEVTNGREHHHLDVPCLVLQNENSDVPLILGRHGFFEEFEITFKQNSEKIVLKKTNSKMKY